MSRVSRIVLTGGPGGGKTSVLSELRRRDPRAERFLIAPEAASMLLRAGHRSGTQVFQLAIVRLQLALEAQISAAEQGHEGRPRLLICERGTVDSLAYWRHYGWPEEAFFSATGMDLGEHLGRYDGVVHLQTAAVGAEVHYRQGPKAGRLEPASEAAAIDAACVAAWSDHPCLLSIANEGLDWALKLGRALDALEHWSA